MKILMVAPLLGITTLCLSAQTPTPAQPKLDQAYAYLKEAYQARDQGNKNLAREKTVAALALLRELAGEKTPQLMQSTTDLALEESAGGVKVTENRNLFKVEFKTDQALLNRILQQQQELFRQQQLILQKLGLLSQENTDIKNIVSVINSNTKEVPDIVGTVDEIKDDTSQIADLETRLQDVEDNTQDIPDIADSVADIADNTDNISDLADGIEDIKDDSDILDEILNLVEDIKDDTDKIGDIENAVEDVKNSSGGGE